MEWECLKCGTFNAKFNALCSGCNLDRDHAISMNIKLKTVCEGCGHKHKGGKFCHVFIESIDEGDLDLDDEDIEIGGDDNKDDDNDSTGGTKGGGLGGTTAGGPERRKLDPLAPLPTPDHVQKAGFMRCNCTEGIPDGSKRFKKLEKRQYCGDIEVGTWERLMDAPPVEKMLTADQEEAREVEAVRGRMDIYRKVMPWVLRYSELGKEAPTCVVVCKAFRDGTLAYQPYVEMRDCTPTMVYRVHQGQVDSMTLVVMPGTEQRVLFTGGDRRVMASDIDKGEVITQVTRDSGEIPLLFEQEFRLITASSNGSIRFFALSHVLSRTKLTRTVWEHSRNIRGMLMAEPSVGYCRAHGIENHVCEFYTASEDRKIIIWDQQSGNPIRLIDSKVIRHNSFISLAHTRRHLIAGTSDAALFIFTKHNECERSDVHSCSTPGAKKNGCLQVALRLPSSIVTTTGAPPAVISLHVGRVRDDYVYPSTEDFNPDDPDSVDPNYANVRLFAGDITGQLTVWSVPEFVGIDYRPILTRPMHHGPLNVIQETNAHIVTLGDDGFVNILAKASLIRVKHMDLHKAALAQGFTEAERVLRKLKSIEIHYDSGGSGTMIVGTSFGDVYVLPLGFTL